MRRALVSAALVSFAVSAPASARAYVRTVAQDTGIPLFWPLPAMAYRVNVDRPQSSPGGPSCSATPAGDPALEAIQASFAAWRQPCANLDMVYAGTTSETRIALEGFGQNVVVFRQGWCSNHPLARFDSCMGDWEVDCGDIYGCFEDHSSCPLGIDCPDRSVVALTSVIYAPATGRIFDADIQVNGWDGTSPGGQLGSPPSNGWYFTCDRQAGWGPCTTYGQSGCYYMDLQNTITHEAGHVLGLAHEDGDPESTMFSQTDAEDLVKRTLSPDDVAGVCAIYPEPSGCSTAGGGAGLLVMLLGPFLLRRTRNSDRLRFRPR